MTPVHSSSIARDASPKRIAIIGGGLTGLAAAHRLIELTSTAAVEIHLFEAGSRLGGLVGTVERDGYLIDTGADSFITNKPGALQLCQRLGLAESLQSTDSRFRGALVLCNGRPYPVPEGFQLLSPTAIWPVMMSPVLSWWGKLRLAGEYFVPRSRDIEDETLGSFVRRRFGREAMDRLVQPLVGGIYTSDPEKLSLAATMPRFLEMERTHGSLIKASRLPSSTGEDRTSSGARYGLFAGLKRGMQELVDALSTRISPRCQIHRNTRITNLEELKDASDRRSFRLTMVETEGATSTDTFDAVIVTTASHQAAQLFAVEDPALAAELQQIDYASSVIVVTGHRLADVQHPLDAFGLVVPHRERRRILAVSFSSRKFPNRAPADRVLLRTFVGGAMQPEYVRLDDAEIVTLVREELGSMLGVTGEPDFALVVRYPRAMPQYHLGHVTKVANIARLMVAHPGLELAGNAYLGVGVPDAIHSGEQAATRIVSHLGQMASVG